ncbi:MAG TPA: amidohydrolase family protein [Myxococcales bacterium]|nr:amidohydrolase family protein [Myxococcales bacterium]
MRTKHLFAIAAVLSSFSLAALPDRQRTIYYNGKIFTADARTPWVEGLAVQGDQIISTGENREVLGVAETGATLVDLHGQTVIPGLNDAHVHPYDITSFPRAAHLNAAADFIPNPGPNQQDVLALVRQGVANNPKGTWLFVIVGTAIVEDPTVDRFILDTIAPDHPVMLEAWYGHGTYLNTKAIQTIGLSETEPDPFGGFYARVPGSNRINGVVHEYAEHLIKRFFANQMTDKELIDLYASFAKGAAAAGYTSVQAMSIGLPQDRYVELLSRSNLPIRWRAICVPLTLDESCQTSHAFQATSSLTSNGIKWIADGTDIERFAFLTEDYKDAPGARGHLNFPAAAIQTELQRTLREQGQPLFHSVGDATSDTILDEMAAVASDGHWRGLRPRIEHGTLLRPERYQSASNKGVYVVQNPLHFALVDVAVARFKSDLLADIDPMKSLLKAGIHVALGSDSVAVPGSPYLDLFFAVTQPTHLTEALTTEEAVIAYTRTAAEAEFQEQSKGTLVPGKLADFVVLSQDIFKIDTSTQATAAALIGTTPLLTVVGGKRAFDKGQLPGLAKP